MVGLVALKIWKTYALPLYIYGMETQTYSKWAENNICNARTRIKKYGRFSSPENLENICIASLYIWYGNTDILKIRYGETIERYQRKICRQLQQLPERCASTAVYALLGVEPIETGIDRNMLYSSWALPDYQTLLNSRFYSVSYIWLIHMTRTLFVVSEKF